MSIAENITKIKNELKGLNVQLIVVSKTQTLDTIRLVLETGHKIFGENQVQEMVSKWEVLPKDIEWHMIGHLQTNKVKSIAPFICMIHSVDSLKLLSEINKQGKANNRVLDCLLQIHIADEETKFGFSHEELIAMLNNGDWKSFSFVRIRGLMGIATLTEKTKQVEEEFYEIHSFFKGIKTSYFPHNSDFSELSIGMSGDYKIAIQNGSTMIRIGSSIFGKRPIR